MGCGTKSKDEIVKTWTKQFRGYFQVNCILRRVVAYKINNYIILDVRRPDEYAEGHIPGAINLANEEIIDKEPELLPDKKQTIYVYCRSGNRSKQAAEKLAEMQIG